MATVCPRAKGCRPFSFQLQDVAGESLHDFQTYNGGKDESIIPAEAASDEAFACRTQKHANHHGGEHEPCYDLYQRRQVCVGNHLLGHSGGGGPNVKQDGLKGRKGRSGGFQSEEGGYTTLRYEVGQQMAQEAPR